MTKEEEFVRIGNYLVRKSDKAKAIELLKQGKLNRPLTISERFYNQSQSWFYERIVDSGSYRFRVFIRRNAYDEQSFVRGYVFCSNTMQWNLIVDRPIIGAACEVSSYADKGRKELYQQDSDNVLNELISITRLP